MIQFLADNIDQLDLALDQLAVADRNFDRFALMLVDNVKEKVNPSNPFSYGWNGWQNSTILDRFDLHFRMRVELTVAHREDSRCAY